jgi:PadR family transcriptional regulator, regulatory protein PadR
MANPFESQSLGRRVNELLILAGLRDTPMHGYQIALVIEERSGGYFPFHHGTLYPILHRLEQEGLIAGKWSDPDRGRARKQYALTEAGRCYLAETVREWRSFQTRLEPFLRGEAGDGQVQGGAA